MLLAIDHVNLRTDDPAGLADWYEAVLGLTRGPRPDFGFPGEWLYLGDEPVVHLVYSKESPGPYSGSLEHFAFRAKGMSDFIERLERAGVSYDKANVAGTDIVQFHVHDPAGNHVHIDFRTSTESAA